MSTCKNIPSVFIRLAIPVQFGGRGTTDPLPLNPGHAPVLGGEPNKAPSSMTWPRTHWSTCPTTLLLPRRETKRVPRIHPSRLGLKKGGNPERGRQSGRGSPDDQIVLVVPKWEDQGGGDPAPSPPLSGAGAGEEKGDNTFFGDAGPGPPHGRLRR